MENLPNPYEAPYQEIVAVVSPDKTCIELIETFDCVGGGMWSLSHYAKSPLVLDARIVGNTLRYKLSPGFGELDLVGSKFPAGISGVKISGDEVAVSYSGLGGGGVGASICRAKAKGVLRSETTPSGGGKTASSTVYLQRMERVIIGIDDTDTPEEGATWALSHNIAKSAETKNSRYLSHTITQLYPVPQRTKNCVAVALEFATCEPEKLIETVHRYLEKYTLSDKTGMAVFRGFDPKPLEGYGWKVKSGFVGMDELDHIAKHLDIRMNGSGIIGAVAAIPFYTKYEEALQLCGNH